MTTEENEDFTVGRACYAVALRDPANAGLPRNFDDLDLDVKRTWQRAALVEGSPLLKELEKQFGEQV